MTALSGRMAWLPTIPITVEQRRMASARGLSLHGPDATSDYNIRQMLGPVAFEKVDDGAERCAGQRRMMTSYVAALSEQTWMRQTVIHVTGRPCSPGHKGPRMTRQRRSHADGSRSLRVHAVCQVGLPFLWGAMNGR